MKILRPGPRSAKDVALNQLMTQLGMTATNSEASRLIEGGGVSIDSEKVSNSKLKLDLNPGREFIIKAGKKKFLKVIVGNS